MSKEQAQYIRELEEEVRRKKENITRIVISIVMLGIPTIALLSIGWFNANKDLQAALNPTVCSQSFVKEAGIESCRTTLENKLQTAKDNAGIFDH